MMKREINLLPLSFQRKRTRRLYFGRFGRLLNRVYILLAVVVVAQAGVLTVYYSILGEMSAWQRAPSSSVRDVRREAREFNELLTDMSEQMGDQVIWTALLEDVLAAVEGPILVTGLEVGDESQVLKVRGTSPSRSAVVALRANLERLSWVAQAQAPLENFIVGPGAEFSLSIHRQ